jgi:S1-C subfamily serine protease
MDKETKQAWIMWGGIALLVALYFGGKAIYMAYENQQQQIEALTKQQQDSQQQAQNAQTELQQVESKSTPDLSTIIATWRPIIAHIACQFNDGNILLGSSTLVLSSVDGSKDYVITNRHVIDENLSGNYASSCGIKFPLDDTIFSASNPNASGGSDLTIATNNSDEARIFITPDSYLTAMTTEGRHECDSIPNVGDSIVILGYPSIGSQTDITATQGIISGYDGDYYITSAGIDHGNSGGAAIDEKNNCYLGIPTWAESGSFESLGRILKWQAF